MMEERVMVAAEETKREVDGEEAAMTEATQRTPETLLLHEVPTSVPAEKPSSSWMNNGPRMNPQLSAEPIANVIKSEKMTPIHSTGISEKGPGDEVAKEGDMLKSQERPHVTASAATDPATANITQNTVTRAPEAVAAKPATTEAVPEASIPLPPVSRPTSAPNLDPSPNTPAAPTRASKGKKITNKITDEVEELAYFAFREELLDKETDGEGSWKQWTSDGEKRDREWYIQRRWRAKTKLDRRPYYDAAMAKVSESAPSMPAGTSNAHVVDPQSGSLAHADDKLQRIFAALPANMSLAKYAQELYKASRRPELRAHFLQLSESETDDLLNKTWLESESCRKKWHGTARRFMLEKGKRDTKAEALQAKNDNNKKKAAVPLAVAKSQGVAQTSKPAPRFDFAIIDTWAMKHKNSLVESTTTLNDNIDSESNQAALIDAANLLLKDNCSIFEAERILFHCFIPQAQKYNKFIKNDRVVLEALKHVVKRASAAEPLRANKKITKAMNAPQSIQVAKLKILSSFVDIISRYQNITEEYLRVTSLAKFVKDHINAKRVTTEEMKRLAKRTKQILSKWKEKWKESLTEGGGEEPLNGTEDGGAPKSNAGVIEHANGKRKREDEVDDDEAVAPSSDHAGAQKMGDVSTGVTDSAVPKEEGGDPAAEIRPGNAEGDATAAAAKRKSEEEEQLRKSEERRRLALLKAMDGTMDGKIPTGDDAGQEQTGTRKAKRAKKSVRFREDSNLVATKFFLRLDQDTTKLFDTIEMVGQRQDEVVRETYVPVVDEGCQILWHKPEPVWYSDRDLGLVRRIDFRKVMSDMSDKYKMAKERFFKLSDSEDGYNPIETDETVAAVDRLAAFEPPTIIPLEEVDAVGGGQFLQFQPQNDVHERNRFSSKRIKCHFFAKGLCTRGDQCTFSHEL